MEIGVYSFADTAPDPRTGHVVSSERRLRDLIDEIELADQVGLDVYGVGEHHRPDFAVSAPAVVLAAAAERTVRIRLTSAVSVLSSDDPVRVFQDFATLDLLLRLRDAERVTWTGRHRPSLDDRGVYPRPLQEPLPVWLAVGGTPNSVVRAAVLGLPLALAIIGGMPERFVPLIRLYRDAAHEAGYEPEELPVGINGHVYLADTSKRAADELYPSYAAAMNRIGRERGWSPMTREQYEGMREPRGSLAVGSPSEVIEKILHQNELFGNRRFLAQVGVGTLPHDQVMHAIELLGTVVAPAVRAHVNAPGATPRR